MTPTPGTPSASPYPRRGTLAAARSYGVGIVRPGRCGRWGASVASGGTKGDVPTSLSARCNQVTSRESRASDTVDRPAAVPQALPLPGSSREASGRTWSRDRNTHLVEPHALGNSPCVTLTLGWTREAPASGLVWRLTTDRGSRPRGPGQAMTRDRHKCIHSPPLTPSPRNVSVTSGVLT